MAKDSEIKNGERTFTPMFTDSTSNDQSRLLKCQNCNYIWETESHPNTFKVCPSCGVDNNSTRRTIFFWSKELKIIMLD